MKTEQRRFMRIGITGGIAAGKSTVSKHLISRGYNVIDYDQLAREIVLPHSPIVKQIEEEFGSHSVNEDGTVNRLWLAHNVFTDDNKRHHINDIMHPAVYALAVQKERDIITQNPDARMIFHDIPLLIETLDIAKKNGFVFDHIMTIEADDDIRIQRMIETRGMAKAEARARIDAQLTREQREATADVVIDSNLNVKDMLSIVDNTLENWLTA
ncbi:dephospho-CoA kinase [Alloscardovia theropitheci]|uniref:Dephospho-CoA kinase n=1 Tax=Alloscardovia theropitheci TaxID=2496842 RepID=A0A4V2MU17_9BIFI|nr:dephospho-CoA kinase [Alloscardovia theropitheci]TCD54599.1 dephospho-CoA kinase [Alloscardovia theropitheci]